MGCDRFVECFLFMVLLGKISVPQRYKVKREKKGQVYDLSFLQYLRGDSADKTNRF